MGSRSGRVCGLRRVLDGPAGLVVLGSGAIPLATAGDRRVHSSRRPARRPAGAREQPLFGRHRRDLPRGRGHRRRFPISPPTTPCHAGWMRPGLRRDGPRAAAGDSRSTSIARSTLSLTRDESVGDLPDRVAAVRVAWPAFARGRWIPASVEFLVAGRTSATTPPWLERNTPSRTRAIVEERGLRTAAPGQRPPASVLGALLDRDGPGSIGTSLRSPRRGRRDRHARPVGPPARPGRAGSGQAPRIASRRIFCVPRSSPIRGCEISRRAHSKHRFRSSSAVTRLSDLGFG